MGLRDFLLRRRRVPVTVLAPSAPEPVAPPPVPIEEVKDIQLAMGPKPAENQIEKTVRERWRLPIPIVPYGQTQSVTRDQLSGLSYEPSHHDLSEFAKARDNESLIATSIERHVEIALQNGWDVEGQDEKMLDYLRHRLRVEIPLISGGVTFQMILEQLLDQISTYGTAFLVVNRNKKFSNGKSFRLYGKDLDPIANWAVVDAPTMEVAQNASGQIIGWKQTVNEWGSKSRTTGGTKEFHPTDVFQFVRHKQAGRVFGRSMYTPVLDDALMLRVLEDLVQVVSQKYANPLFQYIVGTEKAPAEDEILQDGTRISEVDKVRFAIQTMAIEGGFVTPERHEIKLIGTEGKVMDLTGYLEHFRQRVQDGTRMSNAALGTGKGEQSKSTAAQQISSLNDSAEYYQGLLTDQMFMFFLHLLMEGDFDVDHENMPKLKFGAPDVETTMAKENHHLNQFQAGAITEPELRKHLNKKPLTEEQRKLTVPEMQHEKDVSLQKMAAKERAKTQAAAAKKKPGAKKKASSGSKKKATAAKATIAITVRPENQHGKKATKSRVKKNDYMMELMSVWQDARTAVLAAGTDAKFRDLMGSYSKRMGLIARRYLETAVQDGTWMAREEQENDCLIVTIRQRDKIFETVSGEFDSLMQDCADGLKTEEKLQNSAAFSLYADRLRDMAERQIVFVQGSACLAAMYNAGVPQDTFDTRNGDKVFKTSAFCDTAIGFAEADVEVEEVEEEELEEVTADEA